MNEAEFRALIERILELAVLRDREAFEYARLLPSGSVSSVDPAVDLVASLPTPRRAALEATLLEQSDVVVRQLRSLMYFGVLGGGEGQFASLREDSGQESKAVNVEVIMGKSYLVEGLREAVRRLDELGLPIMPPVE